MARVTNNYYRLVLFLAVVSVALISPSPSSAREWNIVGPRALGMGGAHVAVANDATAAYWNPAAYGFFAEPTGGDYSKRKTSAVLGAGAGVSIHEGLGEQLDKISQYNYDLLDNGQIEAKNVAEYVQLLNDLKTFGENENRAAKVSAEAQFGLQFGHFGIAGLALAEISAKGQLDTVNIAPETLAGTTDLTTTLSNTANLNNGTAVPAGDHYLSAAAKTDLTNQIAAKPGWTAAEAANFVQAVDYGLAQAQASGVSIPSDITTDILGVATIASAAQTGGSFEDNTSQLLFKGIAVAEVPLTYGLTLSEDLAIGGNLKYMKGRTYNVGVKIFNTDFEDSLSEARDDYKESSTFGIDLGLLYRFGDDLRVGVVGRNLNSPKFDMNRRIASDDDSITEKPQVRAGVCYKPISFIMLAADYDVTKNETMISGSYDSQNIALGAEFNVLNFLRLRGGAYKNLAQGDIGWVYTAGFGLNFWLFNLDAAAAMTSEKETIDGQEYPKEVRAELALSMLF